MHALNTMRALVSNTEVLSLNNGDVLFKTGDYGSTMYGIVEGSVRLSWTDSAGNQGHEDILVGHVFGAGALVMGDHERLGTATALENCCLIEMTREKFLFAVQEDPMFAIELLASIDERLRDIKMGVN